MSNRVSLFPVETAAQMALHHAEGDVRDMAVSFLALASLYDRLAGEKEETEQALEVALIRLGLDLNVRPQENSGT